MKRFAPLLLIFAFACASQKPTPVASFSPAGSSTPMTSPELGIDLQPDVQLDRDVYAPGQEIKVTAIAAALSDSAWVWIVPAEQKPELASRPDKGLANFATFEGTKGGEVIAAAPVAAGRYALCLYAQAEKGPELARREFEVQTPSEVEASESPTPLVTEKVEPFSSATPR